MKRILFIVGFVSLLSQIVLLRELNAAYFGVELIYTIAIAFWLAGTAVGAAVNRKYYIPKIKIVQLILLLSSLIIPIEIFFIRGIRLLSGEAPGAFLPIGKQVLFLSAALIPLSFLMGLAFQWSAKIFINQKQNLSSAYAIESAGGIAGGLLAALLTTIGLSNLQAGLLCSFSVIFIYTIKNAGIFKSKLFLVQCFFSAFFILLFVQSEYIDLHTASWNNCNIIKTIDTPYSRVSISQNGGQYTIFEDDAISYETESVSAEEFCGIALLASENPRKTLLLGGGYRGFAAEILKIPNTTVDYVEYNKKMIDALTPYLPIIGNDTTSVKRINFIYSDPRVFLHASNKYDVILMGLPEPASCQTNRYYTKEFFKLCAQNLKTEGILAFSLRSEENLWSPVLTKRNASIYKTLKSAFDDVVVLPGTMSIFIASAKLVNFNAEALTARFKERGVEAKVISPQYIKYLLNNDRFEKIKLMLSHKTAPVNSDNNPVSYQYTIAIWLSKFFPAMSAFSIYTPGLTGVIIFALLLSAFFSVIRKFKTIKSYTQIFSLSMLAMIMEITLLIKYQTSEGILFQNIGLLLTAFMAGLSAGAFFITALYKSKPPEIKLNYILIFLFVLLNGLAAFLICYSNTGLIIIMLLIFADGFLVSALFSVLSFSSKKTQAQITSPLYAADILGGCAGSLTAGLILIPMFGLPGVLLLIGVTALITMILV